MKNLLLIVALLALPLSAGAEYMDVIQVKLDDDCSVQKYVQIKNDFNEQWGKNNGYMAEVSVPIQNDDLVSIFWVGRTANAAAFGAAWDAWRDGITNSGSSPPSCGRAYSSAPAINPAAASTSTRSPRGPRRVSRSSRVPS